MAPPRNRTRWLGLRDAFELAGQALQSNWLGLAKSSPDAVTAVREVVWHALDTGKVTVLLDYLRNPDQPSRLKVEDLHHWLFRMDPHNDVLFLGALPDGPWRCEIDRQEFVAALHELGVGAGPSANRQERCRNWLLTS